MTGDDLFVANCCGPQSQRLLLSSVGGQTEEKKNENHSVVLKRARFPVDVGHVLLLIDSDMRPTVIHYARGEGCLG